ALPVSAFLPFFSHHSTAVTKALLSLCCVCRSSRRERSRVHWLEAWPSRAGYTTVESTRVASFSRHLQILRSLNQVYSGTMKPVSLNLFFSIQPSTGRSGSRPGSSTPYPSNSLSPFHTTMKPTCGYFFAHDTDNKKRRIGIPPSNLVAWRSKVGHTHTQRAQTAH
ncbi:Putative uncharacterized protein GUCA1ANB, partial [Geodia barretti]